MTRVYCTLFNISYLTRGVALYKSLLKHSDRDFLLYVFCFDQETEQVLERLKLKNMILISLSKFEDQELLSVKSSRTIAEYCWTSTPKTIQYIFNNFGHDHCTYLDADIFFFSSPERIFEENIKSSVFLTEHRYLKNNEKKYLKFGRYCVQFMYFKNDHYGSRALNWWAGSCVKWCYNKLEDGKFGDQKYLDDWTDRFEKVHVVKTKGAGLAPWNALSFKSEIKGKGLFLDGDKLVFYHFHGLRFYDDGKVDLGYWKLPKIFISFIYQPYLKLINEISNQYFGDLNLHKINASTIYKEGLFQILKRKIKRTHYVFELKRF